MRRDNAAAQRLYIAQGYQVIGERVGYYAHLTDAVRYQKRQHPMDWIRRSLTRSHVLLRVTALRPADRWRWPHTSASRSLYSAVTPYGWPWRMIRISALMVCVVLFTLLAGCGNKGELVRAPTTLTPAPVEYTPTPPQP